MKKIKILLLLIILSQVFNLSLVGKVQVPNTKNMTGHHLEVDDVGNKYYYSNTLDIEAYGDFRTHYKNGETYKLKYDGKVQTDTLYFITLDHDIDGILENTVIFCIEPNEVAQIIDSTDEAQSAYNDLTQVQKVEVAKLTSAITYKFSKTGNYDYLSAGQLLIWQAIGSELLEIPDSIKKEMDDINKLVENYDTLPSFLKSNKTLDVELTYNENTKRYEAYLEDTNGVLDEHFLQTLVGFYNGYHIEDGPAKDDLYIWTDAPPQYTVLISSTYTLMPSQKGQIAGINYQTQPTFINSGQDLVSGINYKVKIQLNLETKIAIGDAKLKKCGFEKDDCTPLEGVIFGLYNDNDKEISRSITDQNGEIIFEDLELGHYYVKEIKTQDKYELDSTEYEFDIVRDEDHVLINSGEYIENKLIKGRIRLNKVGITKNNDNTLYPLQGVEFTIYEDINANGLIDSEDNPKEVLVTDKEGQIISSDLEYGHYIIKETKALEGYINNGYEEPFFIQNQGEVIELAGGMDLVNDMKTGTVDLLKVGEDTCFECENIPLQGVEFAIYEDFDKNNKIDEDDVLVQTITTDNLGYAKSSELIYGNYNAKEVKTLEGYQISDQIYPFEIKGFDNVSLNFGDPILNKLKLKKIILNKHDQFENPIPGVEFELYKDKNEDDQAQSEEFLTTIKTDENGKAIGTLPKGRYILKEVLTPSGYQNIQEDYLFYVDSNTLEDTVVDIQNDLILGDVKVVKKDLEDDSLLEGVEFAFYKDNNENGKIDKDDQYINNYITDVNGEIIIQDLKYGKYLLQEVKPLEDYAKNKQIYKINIDGSKEVYEIEVYNQKTIKQITQKLVNTSTGIRGILNKVIIIIFIIFLSIVILIIYLKKKSRNYI